MVLKREEFNNLTKYIKDRTLPIIEHDIINDLIDTIESLYIENESLRNKTCKN